MATQTAAPILVIIGKKDIQVDWQIDGSRWEALAKERNNLAIAYPDNANHVLKYEPRSKEQLSPADIATSYNADGSSLDLQVVETIAAWLNPDR